MDQKIKNFDRSIEQKLNENEVAPPFGMWNRISAQLDVAETLPVAAAAPVALISKRHIAGFIAAAALISSSLITAYLVSAYKQSKNTPNPVNQTLVATTAKTEHTIPPAPELSEHKVAVKFTNKSAPAVAVVVNEEPLMPNLLPELPTNDLPSANLSEVAVPDFSIIQSTDKASDVYYFPPVDAINQPTEKATISNESSPTKIITTEKITEKKISKSSSSEKRIMLRRHNKRSGFTYGSLNRLGKHRAK